MSYLQRGVHVLMNGRNNPSTVILLRSVFRVRSPAGHSSEAANLVIPQSVTIRESITTAANVLSRQMLLLVLTQIARRFEGLSADFADVFPDVQMK